jgi:hypothetical protein
MLLSEEQTREHLLFFIFEKIRYVGIQETWRVVERTLITYNFPCYDFHFKQL